MNGLYELSGAEAALEKVLELLIKDDIKHQQLVEMLADLKIEIPVESSGMEIIYTIADDWNDFKYDPVRNNKVNKEYVHACMDYLKENYSKA